MEALSKPSQRRVILLVYNKAGRLCVCVCVCVCVCLCLYRKKGHRRYIKTKYVFLCKTSRERQWTA